MDSTKRRIDKELGKFIHDCCVKSGSTIEELAWSIGVEPRTLSYYFSGLRKPSQRTLLRLVKAAKISVGDIPF
ncbi:MAG: helix-turn-helix transcriptional regulator [Bacilli bacterium]|nr:helix-turn-helix transcriptional regulator [Bacilli bacterium]